MWTEPINPGSGLSRAHTSDDPILLSGAYSKGSSKSSSLPNNSSLSSQRRQNSQSGQPTNQEVHDTPLYGAYGSPRDPRDQGTTINLQNNDKYKSLERAPAVKYDDGLRHASFSASMSQTQMSAGSARISKQHDRRSSPGRKSEWSNDPILPSGNPHYSPSLGLATPNISFSSPSRSPNNMPSSTLVDRPARKRGKLPKETTDYLKAWLHSHSDHPYPSEEEKEQLCHATGLSMSQVSKWMISVSRRPCSLFF
jgi:hypothetical protein